MSLHIFHLLLSQLCFATIGGLTEFNGKVKYKQKRPADHRGDQESLNESPGRAAVEISAT